MFLPSLLVVVFQLHVPPSVGAVTGASGVVGGVTGVSGAAGGVSGVVGSSGNDFDGKDSSDGVSGVVGSSGKDFGGKDSSDGVSSGKDFGGKDSSDGVSVVVGSSGKDFGGKDSSDGAPSVGTSFVGAVVASGRALVAGVASGRALEAGVASGRALVDGTSSGRALVAGATSGTSLEAGVSSGKALEAAEVITGAAGADGIVLVDGVDPAGVARGTESESLWTSIWTPESEALISDGTGKLVTKEFNDKPTRAAKTIEKRILNYFSLFILKKNKFVFYYIIYI